MNKLLVVLCASALSRATIGTEATYSRRWTDPWLRDECNRVFQAAIDVTSWIRLKSTTGSPSGLGTNKSTKRWPSSMSDAV